MLNGEIFWNLEIKIFKKEIGKFDEIVCVNNGVDDHSHE
jgi:hypothetical protein